MSDKETASNKEEEALVPVGDGVDPPEVPEEEVKEGTEKGDTESSVSVDEDDEDDERVGHSEDEEGLDNSKLREKRRKERKNRRERSAREMRFLRQRNEQMERQLSEIALRQTKHEKITVNQRIGELEAKLAEVDSIYDQAIIAKDSETASQARQIRKQLEGTRDHLLRATVETEQQEKEQEQQRAAPRVPPPELSRAREWVGRNEWFDPNLHDERSHLVKVMEDRLKAEGDYEPSDPEYWNELDRRIAKRFPEVGKKAKKVSDDPFSDDDDDLPPTRSAPPPEKKKPNGPKFSVGGRTRSLKSNEVFISAERRKALEEAGVWDDPVLRERYMKSYQSYDADAARNKN